jgi:hypothetical protein
VSRARGALLWMSLGALVALAPALATAAPAPPPSPDAPPSVPPPSSPAPSSPAPSGPSFGSVGGSNGPSAAELARRAEAAEREAAAEARARQKAAILAAQRAAALERQRLIEGPLATAGAQISGAARSLAGGWDQADSVAIRVSPSTDDARSGSIVISLLVLAALGVIALVLTGVLRSGSGRSDGTSVAAARSALTIDSTRARRSVGVVAIVLAGVVMVSYVVFAALPI